MSDTSNNDLHMIGRIQAIEIVVGNLVNRAKFNSTVQEWLNMERSDIDTRHPHSVIQQGQIESLEKILQWASEASE